MQNSGVTLNTAYLRPRSRGTVRLASGDPAAAPLLDPNYWSDSHDRTMAIKGLRLARDILRQAVGATNPRADLGQQIRARFASFGGVTLALPKRGH